LLIWWSCETLSIFDEGIEQVIMRWTQQSDKITTCKSDNLPPGIVECPTMDVAERSVGYFRIPAGDSPSE
jgi:hypothetical protein